MKRLILIAIPGIIFAPSIPLALGAEEKQLLIESTWFDHEDPRLHPVVYDWECLMNEKWTLDVFRRLDANDRRRLKQSIRYLHSHPPSEIEKKILDLLAKAPKAGTPQRP